MKRLALASALSLASTLLLAPMSLASGFIVVDTAVTPVGGFMMPIRPPVIGHPVGHPPTIVHPVGTPPTPPTLTPPTVLKGGVSFGLHMQSEEIKVDIVDQVAKTYITQTFMNDTDQILAGTYLFPLPEDTTFSSFSLHIDGKPVEGKILEAQEARQQYEAIVRSMVDPGLLEYADYKTVRARIFPIPAHGTKKVELEYTQVLKAENGMLKYRFPLKAEGESAPVDEVKIDAKLSSKQGLRTIWSPTHTISTNRTDNNEAKISMLSHEIIPDKDFLLYYSVSNKDLAANLLTHKNSGEDGYFLLTITPPVKGNQVLAKDVVLVADTSGSMAGEKIEQAKKALKYVVNALNAEDKFSIVQFNTDVECFKDKLVDATAQNKKAAEKFIDDLDPRGGTNISDALHMGTSILADASDRPAYLVMMTDGEPTVGETSIPGLISSVKSKRDIRLFDFGVGYDVNTKLLNKLAEEHHGTSQYVEPSENLEEALSNFYQKIKSPVLTNVALKYEGVDVKDFYPHEVKDIFAGSQVLLIGKYKDGGKATLNLTGKVNGVQKAFSFPLTFEPSEAGHSYLPRLWAMRRIGHLTEVAQENGNNREVVSEIVDLSKKYGIITNYTSFLVTDPSESHGTAMNRPGLPWIGAAVSRRTVRGSLPMTATSSVDFNTVGLPPTTMDSFVHEAPGAPAAHQHYQHYEPGAFAASSAGHGYYKASTAGKSLAALPPPSALPAPSLQGATNGTIGPMADANIYGDEGSKAMPGFPSASFASAGFTTGHGSSMPDAWGGDEFTGAKAVANSKALNSLKQQNVLAKDEGTASGIKAVDDKTFYLHNGVWVDSAYTDKLKPEVITFGTDAYFDLLHNNPGIAKYLAVGKEVIFLFNGHTYKIVATATS